MKSLSDYINYAGPRNGGNRVIWNDAMNDALRRAVAVHGRVWHLVANQVSHDCGLESRRQPSPRMCRDQTKNLGLEHMQASSVLHRKRRIELIKSNVRRLFKLPLALNLRENEPEPLGKLGEIGEGCRYIHGEVVGGNWVMCDHPLARRKTYGVKLRFCEYHSTVCTAKGG